MFVINPRVSKLSAELIERYRAVQPATIGHLIEFGFCDPALRPVWRTFKLVGPAVTVRTSALDSAIVHMAIDVAEPGDVILIDRNGDQKHACWGEMTSLAAKLKGIAGAIVDGCTTDIAEIEEMKFPVYSRQASPITTKGLALEGEINTVVQIGGVPVNPGDLVVGDVNGILIVPANLAPELIDASETREQREGWVRAELHKGRKLSDISAAAEKIRAQMQKESH
jgi:4-hydroxy-4-methyl-2-oxoglutarate aldolase